MEQVLQSFMLTGHEQLFVACFIWQAIEDVPCFYRGLFALTVFEKDNDKLFIRQKLVANSNTQPDKKYSREILPIENELTG